jgi:hypothetical protein
MEKVGWRVFLGHIEIEQEHVCLPGFFALM